ncbi:bacterial alpha-L-rhamnosidase-domain-containing protein [Aspergillus cavernicola]|uniref:alpha-L-rhamnosidase n=1 Tax=Aspergillus cavernicola TaxID=176166 RepID=A0ABR4IVB6_9EURO
MPKFRVATGFAGTPIIFQALTETNHLNLAYRMLMEDRCPSWLYPITQGATTIWECWDSMLPDGSINPGSMTSFNHYALGSVLSWLHEKVGGLRPLEPGWKTALVSPQPGDPLTSASVSYESSYGTWSCRWQLVPDGDGKMALVVGVSVPPNTTAIIRLFAIPEKRVGSGHYQFRVPYCPEPNAPEAIAPYITNPGQGI